MATIDGEAIHSLQKQIEDMRNLTLCKICLKPFYEPYILGCGHTYCYSCLRNWFGGGSDRRKNRNCPDCRTIVNTTPAPNYLLRDLAHLFIGRTELLPEDETVEEHVRDKEEEAKVLMQDRNGPGLFQGVFKIVAHPFLPPMHVPHAPIRDLDDGVLRCPVCAHEMVDGICSGCGLSYDSEDDDIDISELDDDEDDDSSDSDDLTIEHDDRHPIPIPIPRFHGPEIDEDDSEDDDDGFDGSEADQYDVNDGFIDNENEDDVDDIDGPGDYDMYPTDAATPYSEGNSQAGTNYDTEDEIRGDPHRFHAAIRNNVVLDSDDEVPPQLWSEEDEEDNIRAPRSRLIPPSTRGRRPIVISDDEEEEEGWSSRPSSSGPGFQAPDLSDTSNDEANEHVNLEDTSNSELESASSSDSLDDEDDESEDNSEESDDTAIPPRPGRDRRNRLQEHRSRRSQPGTTRVSIDYHAPQPRNYGRMSRSEAMRSGRRGRLTVY